MLTTTSRLLARGEQRAPFHMWGAPGAPIIKLQYPEKGPWRLQSGDLLVTYTHAKRNSDRLLHYLGKHVPHPQKSLWSPDTPQPHDAALTMLTTVDIDAFKYWFGVKRALLEREAWKVLWRSGLVPPSWYQKNPLVAAPIFEKEELYRYYLKHRAADPEVERQRDHRDYQNAIVRTEAEKEADRPRAPFF